MRASDVIAAGAFCIGILVSSANAKAQTAPYFVVTNDGSSYQGDLVENVVGQHVTIRLASGELRTFQAADVKAQGNVGSSATVTLPNGASVTQQQADALTALAQIRAQALAQSLTVTPGTPGAPPVAYTGPDAVQIHITKANDSEGTLLGETPSGWQPVCTMPCTTTVDPKVDYKLHNTDAFRFPAPGPLDLIADTGGHRIFSAIGWTLTGVGLAASIPALLIQLNLFSGGGTARTSAEMTAQSSQRNSNTIDAIVIYSVAGAMLVAGIIIRGIHPPGTLTTSTGQRLVKLGVPLTKKLTLTPTGIIF
jgi:hypothetical protein